MKLTEPDIQRFWEKVDRSPGFGPQGDCWRWIACERGNGYGCIKIAGKVYDAHRVSFVIANGNPPTKLACHRCDNRLCVNPDHIYDGSHSENLRDAFRNPDRKTCRGEAKPNAKLNAPLVRRMRDLWNSGLTTYRIGKMFGVSRRAVDKAVKGMTWSHVQ